MQPGAKRDSRAFDLWIKERCRELPSAWHPLERRRRAALEWKEQRGQERRTVLEATAQGHREAEEDVRNADFDEICAVLDEGRLSYVG